MNVEIVAILRSVNYNEIVAGMGHGMASNNAKFNEELEKIVGGLY